MFENFEDESNKNKKLSILEKSMVLAIVGYFLIMLKKARKAKTYEDLNKLINSSDNFIKTLEKEKEEPYTDEESLNIIEKIKDETIKESEFKN